MTVTEQARHRLHAHLEETMGEEHAAVLMEWLPDGPLASKADIDQLRAATKADIDQLRAATKADIDQLRAANKADIDQLRAATKADIDQLRAATKADIDRLRAANKADIDQLRAANKADIDRLRDVMDARWEHTATKADLGEVRNEIADLRTELQKGFTRQTWALVAAMGVSNSLLLGWFKLLT